MTLNKKDSITVQKESLYRLAYILPLTIAFFYFTQLMLFGPCTIWLSALQVSQHLQITFLDTNGQVYLTGQVERTKLGTEPVPVDFCRFHQHGGRVGCLEERGQQQIKAHEVDSGMDGVTCHLVTRKGLRCPNQVIKDCLDLESAHWYGGFQAYKQAWPLRTASHHSESSEHHEPEHGEVIDEEGSEVSDDVEMTFTPYVTADAGIHKTNLVNVLDRIFFSSSGVAIIVSDDTPLHLSFNQHQDGKLCLAATQNRDHFFKELGKQPKLEYKVCKAKDIKAIYSFLQQTAISKPQGTPHPSLFAKPIWTTWALYKKDINQSAVLQFAEKIVSSNLPYAQLEIDDGWTSQYGDMTFDPIKFPDAKKMVAKLNEMDFPVTVWVHPFLSLKSKAFQEAVASKFTVMSKGFVATGVQQGDNMVPALVRWWNEEMAALLDVTNPAASLWFQNKLAEVREKYNVSSFKFDAGEGLYVPASHKTYGRLDTTSNYGTLWAQLAHASNPNPTKQHGRQEVRVGWKSQHLPIVLRLFDRMSTWEREGGLKSLIPSVLTVSVLGYHFVLPDMIGGNAYLSFDALDSSEGELPDRELYIRWMQASVFMPHVQFSIPPWIYDQQVVSLTQKTLALRESYGPLYVGLSEESVRLGNPIIRPVWWLDPTDPNALVIDDQFLVGDELLVAPVVDKGARKRDIYIPAGKWKDTLRNVMVTGPTTLTDYPVDLEELPLFENQRDSE